MLTGQNIEDKIYTNITHIGSITTFTLTENKNAIINVTYNCINMQNVQHIFKNISLTYMKLKKKKLIKKNH